MATPRKNAPTSKSSARTAASTMAVASASHAAAAEPAHPLAEPGVEPIEIVDTISEQIEGVSELVRLSGELGLEHARVSYDSVKEAAGEAAGNLEAALAAANTGAKELNLKAIDVVHASAEAAFELARSLAAAKTVSEMIELQTAHARKQFETMNEQMKQYAELARKVTSDALSPLSQTLEKTFGRAA
jgi:phasin